MSGELGWMSGELGWISGELGCFDVVIVIVKYNLVVVFDYIWLLDIAVDTTRLIALCMNIIVLCLCLYLFAIIDFVIIIIIIYTITPITIII